MRAPQHPFINPTTGVHRVHPFGRASKHAEPLHEAPGAEDAHAAALALSIQHPLQRFEVYGVPSHVPNAKQAGGAAPAFVPNEGGVVEVFVAHYQAGAEVPIT
jgi:hypothetical protein